MPAMRLIHAPKVANTIPETERLALENWDARAVSAMKQIAMTAAAIQTKPTSGPEEGFFLDALRRA